MINSDKLKAKRILSLADQKLKVLKLFKNVQEYIGKDLSLAELESDIQRDINVVEKLLGESNGAMAFAETTSGVFLQLQDDLNYINSNIVEFINKFPVPKESGAQPRYERMILLGLSSLIESLRSAISGIPKETETISGPEIKLAASLQKSIKQVRVLIDGMKNMVENGDYKKEINELWSACREHEQNFREYKNYLLTNRKDT